MFYEMRTYTLHIGKMKEYLEHFEKEGLPVISRYATLVGWWYTEIGELNQVVHIWPMKAWMTVSAAAPHSMKTAIGSNASFQRPSPCWCAWSRSC